MIGQNGAEILTPAQMRAVEAAAIDSGAVDGPTLMERAGAALRDAIRDAVCADGPADRRAVVLCGPGANGGDGYVVARLLHEDGWSVALFRLGDPERARGDAAEMRRRWLALAPERPASALATDAPAAGLIVDALFGTGLTRPAPREALAAWDAARRAAPAARVLAVDAPLGLCLETGRARPETRAADVTVTFHRAKLGHMVEAGPEACGRLVCADIGLEAYAQAAGSPARRIDGPTRALAKRGAAHKYDYGHALVLAGGVARGGAARMAARAALRVGAGLVTLGAPGAALIENAARLDAIMLRRVDGAEDLRVLLSDRRVAAVVLGPGLGVGDGTAALLDAAAEASRRGVGLVIDADALTTIAEGPGGVSALRARLGARVVMTPHWGEFLRLFPEYRAWPEEGAPFGLPQAARAAAEAAGATVLLKGAATLIAAPDGALSIHAATGARAAPWLATAGAGDVLAGLIGGLLARGAGPREAAETAAWLHVEAARAAGPGLIAEDLPEAVPGVLRGLEP